MRLCKKLELSDKTVGLLEPASASPEQNGLHRKNKGALGQVAKLLNNSQAPAAGNPVCYISPIKSNLRPED